MFDKTELPDKLISEEWQSIGFQGRNPRTDFRGGGYLSLLCLRYFTKNYKEEFQRMIKDPSDTFFTAITSINITHSLVVFFYMNSHEVNNQN